MIYHVSINGNDAFAGTLDAPFRTINRAATIAMPGDTVQVHTGVYRECVNPQNGGFHDNLRITYEAAPGEHPVIKGSEIITDWEKVEGTVWKKELPNSMFGTWNPYAIKIDGDWLVDPKEYDVHLGDVYINGVSLFEASSMEDLKEAAPKEILTQNGWRFDTEYVQHPELTVYRWYAQVDADTTTIFCNFQQYDPNCECIEINVRRSCFYPSQTGINYITVRGFEMAQCACPWTPPTSDQVGMLGPNWSKGWIIENNHLHDAKCSAISIGKEGSTGHNLASRVGRRSGHRRQMESMFQALQAGWSKEKIGSHIIRNNLIHDCGQNGIVGHMGSAFCRIEHNHIYNISIKREFWGHEQGGIKLHAAIDTVLDNNLIHNCSLGTWLDWQSQGMRITRNVYHSNDRDCMIEVTHGPCTFDNNIFLSRFTLDNHAQGTAYVHNLFAGVIRFSASLNRETPYHFPHSTQVAGVAPTYLGDDRLMNNLFLGVQEEAEYWGTGNKRAFNFCQAYDRFTTPEEYVQQLKETGLHPHIQRAYETVPQPVRIAGNAYAGHAKPFRAEDGAMRVEGAAAVLEQEGDCWVLSLTVPESLASADSKPVTQECLETPRMVEQPYENADGTPIDFTKDFFGDQRKNTVIPGPFAYLVPGEYKVIVWKS